MRSRDKGARGERDAAQAWSSVIGGQARRGQQFSGSPESPDVVIDSPRIHLEVKRTERGNLYSWLDQAIADAGEKIPVVLHRRNRREWVLVVRLSDVPGLSAEIAAETQAVGRGQVPCPISREGVPPPSEEPEQPPRVLPYG